LLLKTDEVLMDHIYSGSRLFSEQRPTTTLSPWDYITPKHVSWNLGIKTPNTNRQSCDHYKHNITPVSISSSHPDVSCHFYSLLDNYQCAGMSKSMSGVLWVHVILKLYVRISSHHSRIVIIMSKVYYIRCRWQRIGVRW